MIHTEDHPLAGRKVRLNDTAEDPYRGILVPGQVFEVENWYDRIDPAKPVSWRRVNYLGRLPDDEVVYGHVDGFGHIVHVSELGAEVMT